MRRKGETVDQWEARLFAELEAWVKYDEPLPSPIAVLSIPVDDKIAKAAKANPGSVRISARGVDGIAIVGGAERNRESITLKIHYADRKGEFVDDDHPKK
jgi:hypothetical protein